MELLKIMMKALKKVLMTMQTLIHNDQHHPCQQAHKSHSVVLMAQRNLTLYMGPFPCMGN
jgi:hypothetical protein